MGRKVPWMHRVTSSRTEQVFPPVMKAASCLVCFDWMPSDTLPDFETPKCELTNNWIG